MNSGEATHNNQLTWEEIEKRYQERLEAEKQQKEKEEKRRAEELENLKKMTTAEYIAYRSGKPMPLDNDVLGALSMEEYIKARKKRK